MSNHGRFGIRVMLHAGSRPTLADAIKICAGVSLAQGDIGPSFDDPCIQKVLEGQENQVR